MQSFNCTCVWLYHTPLATVMPAGATTRQKSAKHPFYKGFFVVLIIWGRSKIPVIPVSFCPADKIFASAPANFLLFGRTIQFCGVTKPGYWNGAAIWAECSGGAV
jgi:hypothetical protein